MECPNTVEMGAKEWESLPFVYLFFTKIVFSGGKGVGAALSVVALVVVSGRQWAVARIRKSGSEVGRAPVQSAEWTAKREAQGG